MSERIDAEDHPAWPERPWIMAALLGTAGLGFGSLIDFAEYSVSIPVWKQIVATFMFVAGVATVLVTERRRWLWAAGFALGAGLVLAAIGWTSIGYNSGAPSVIGFSFLSAAFAALIAAPLFQTVRDEGGWRFPYRRLHVHAWTDAVIGAAGIAFVGVTFLVTVLLGALLHLIGIDFIQEALRKSWFGWTLAGTAFGAATGILRESDRLLATLLHVVLIVLSVLAPVFAAGLALFLVALPFTGLAPLWATDSATPILLFCAAGAVLFVNAVIGNGRDDRSGSRILGGAAAVLALTVLPLGWLAALSMGQRIAQHGWTPERLWGAVAVLVAVAYGAVYALSVVRGRFDFDDVLRPLNTRLAIGTCALALLLAMPFVDFGAISTASQIARLENGKVSPEDFDYWALREDFGPAGRRAFVRLGDDANPRIAAAAAEAARTDNRWEDRRRVAARGNEDKVAANLDMADGGTPPKGLVRAVARREGLCVERDCRALALGGTRFAVVGERHDSGALSVEVVDAARADAPRTAVEAERGDKAALYPQTRVEVRRVDRRQVFVEGKPVGDPFE